MIHLADTSIRVYRKGNGKASLRLRSYLMVRTNVGFRLSAYLRDISCRLTLPSGAVVVFDDIGYTEDPTCKLVLDTMVHGFWASAVAEPRMIRNGVGTLRVDYRLSFTNHESEGYESFEQVVPLLRRT